MNIFVNVIEHIGIFAKVILILLLLISVMSWAVIIEKVINFRRINKQSKKFLRFFNDHHRLVDLYTMAHSLKQNPHSRMFTRIYKELMTCVEARQPQKAQFLPMIHDEVFLLRKRDLKNILDIVQREEIWPVEKHMVILATSVSISPFLGLLGTVWGVMAAFFAIGTKHSADIISVGPGISEALITTVAGLAVAIPCLFAYNYFVDRIHTLEEEIYIFGLKLMEKIEKENTV
jgi:biopolymer transport protein TolQ